MFTSGESTETTLSLRLEVLGITFRAPDTGYAVLRCRRLDGGADDRLAATGIFPDVHEGMVLAAGGQWTRHPRFGPQFKVDSWREEFPATDSGIRLYLSSGMVGGIGPVLAGRLVDAFGKDTFDVIENHPERLKEVYGIGRKKIASILEKWNEHKAVRDIMVFLKDHGVSDGLAAKIYRQYGDESIRVLRENPYRMADDIWGVGFRIADRLALALGLDARSAFRLKSGLKFALEEAQREGHMFLPDDQLVQRTAWLLEIPQADGTAEIERSLDEMCSEGRLVRLFPGGETYLPELHEAETEAAARLARMARQEIPLAKAPDIDRIERDSGLRLAPAQRQAVTTALGHGVTILTGGPGTGKTTTVKAILTGLGHAYAKVLLASPTGKAAKRLEEATGRPASTIHRLLEFTPGQGFVRCSWSPLEGDALIVDEASMIDGMLLHRLLDAVPESMRVVFVGDADQLPSVGAGNCLREMIASRAIPTARLTTIFRQAEGSDIITGAHAVNAGKMPDLSGSRDLRFIATGTPEETADTVIAAVSQAAEEGIPAEHIQVLTPMKRGPVGTEELNRRLQQVFNPSGAAALRRERELRVGDRVVNLRNDYANEVFNGDQGTITAFDEDEGTLTVSYDGREVAYKTTEADCLLHAWALTVHRSQGSEFHITVMVVSTQHWTMLQRTLLYTAITRARNLCILVGSHKAIAQAVHNNETKHRYTNLGYLLANHETTI